MPELLFELHETNSYVRKVLDDLGVKYEYPVTKVGIVTTIGSGSSPCVALRADMDALPIHSLHAMKGRSGTRKDTKFFYYFYQVIIV